MIRCNKIGIMMSEQRLFASNGSVLLEQPSQTRKTPQVIQYWTDYRGADSLPAECLILRAPSLRFLAAFLPAYPSSQGEKLTPRVGCLWCHCLRTWMCRKGQNKYFCSFVSLLIAHVFSSIVYEVSKILDFNFPTRKGLSAVFVRHLSWKNNLLCFLLVRTRVSWWNPDCYDIERDSERPWLFAFRKENPQRY